MTSSIWPHLREFKAPPEGDMVEQNPFKLHINMHWGWHFCCKHKNLLCEMLGSWHNWSEIMTLRLHLFLKQQQLSTYSAAWVLYSESWPLINFVKNQAFHIISFCACNKIVTLYACLYGIWKDFVLPCFLLVVLWTLSNEAKMRMVQPHPRISRVSPLDSAGRI